MDSSLNSPRTVQDGKKQKLNSPRSQAYLRVCACVCVCMRACVCACVCERERGREPRATTITTPWHGSQRALLCGEQCSNATLNTCPMSPLCHTLVLYRSAALHLPVGDKNILKINTLAKTTGDVLRLAAME